MSSEIDFPVRDIVEALNLIPGVETFSSCGGHAEITHGSQVGENHFYVNFAVDDLEAVGKVAYAVGQFPGAELRAWYNGQLRRPFTVESLCFELRGDGTVDRERLAARLSAGPGGKDARPMGERGGGGRG